MQELIRVAVDAMGGDNAPAEIVKGAVEALKASTDLKVILVGLSLIHIYSIKCE